MGDWPREGRTFSKSDNKKLLRTVVESKESTLPNLNKNPEPSESGDSSGSQPPVPPQFGSPFDYDATADASLTETSAPTEKTPSTETTGTGPGWDTYSGVGNGPGWGNHPIYPPPTGTESTTAFPAADSDSTPNQPTAPYTSQESYAAQNYPATDYPAPDYSRPTPNPDGRSRLRCTGRSDSESLRGSAAGIPPAGILTAGLRSASGVPTSSGLSSAWLRPGRPVRTIRT